MASSALAALRGRLSLRGASTADPDPRRQWLCVALPRFEEVQRDFALCTSIRDAILELGLLCSDTDAWRDALAEHCDVFLPLDIPSAELWAHSAIVLSVEGRPKDDRSVLFRLLESIFLPPAQSKPTLSETTVPVYVEIDPSRLKEEEAEWTGPLEAFLESAADVLRRITRAQKAAAGVRLDAVLLQLSGFSLTASIAKFVDQVLRTGLRVSELSISLREASMEPEAVDVIAACITGHNTRRVGCADSSARDTEPPAIDALSITQAQPFALATLCLALEAGTKIQGLAIQCLEESAAERDFKWRCIAMILFAGTSPLRHIAIDSAGLELSDIAAMSQVIACSDPRAMILQQRLQFLPSRYPERNIDDAFAASFAPPMLDPESYELVQHAAQLAGEQYDWLEIFAPGIADQLEARRPTQLQSVRLTLRYAETSSFLRAFCHLLGRKFKGLHLVLEQIAHPLAVLVALSSIPQLSSLWIRRPSFEWSLPDCVQQGCIQRTEAGYGSVELIMTDLEWAGKEQVNLLKSLAHPETHRALSRLLLCWRNVQDYNSRLCVSNVYRMMEHGDTFPRLVLVVPQQVYHDGIAAFKPLAARGLFLSANQEA
ncbi:hypothetical protein P43SY_006858 [Pythium insidiosum]|uniref:Uncharacterized protein n=1 Tax=Pythium insidiosum TaxID=114742 RepID=A0AAD5QDW5_PYTIN|nr:hypothetical protein P43SY_006858 [Pythium insidiosum]